MTGRRPYPAQLTAGFTLLEMLVVVTILALVGVLVVPLLARPPDGLRLEAATRDVVGALRLTRAAAVTQNIEMTLIIDADKRTIESPAIPQKALAPDIVVKLTIAKPEQVGPSRGGFRFFPDGSSTGGDLTLTMRERKMRICVNWMTGLAQQGTSC
jgi:general secretion pathway protein H